MTLAFSMALQYKVRDMAVLLKRPSAFLPLLMSSVVLAFIVAGVSAHGTLQQPDEGAGAHLFQILMPAQIPIIIFFALAWLPRDRVHAAQILALQCGVFASIFALVFAFHG